MQEEGKKNNNNNKKHPVAVRKLQQISVTEVPHPEMTRVRRLHSSTQATSEAPAALHHFKGKMWQDKGFTTSPLTPADRPAKPLNLTRGGEAEESPQWGWFTEFGALR